MRSGYPALNMNQIKLSELLRIYVADLETHTSEGHTHRLALIFRRLRAALGDPIAEELRPAAIVEYRARRLRDGLAPSTINKEIGALRTAFRWAESLEIVDRNPLRRLRALRVRDADRRRLKRALTDEELAKLVHEYRIYDESLSGGARGGFHGRPGWVPQTPLLLFLIETGARRGETTHLRWCDFDFQAETVSFRAVTTKTGKGRTLPLSESLCGELVANRTALARFPEDIEPTALTFRSPNGGPWRNNPRNAMRHFDQRCQLAGIRKRDDDGRITCMHALRTTRATRLVSAGVPLNLAQQVLGHTCAATTLMVYTQPVSTEKLREQLEAAGQLGVGLE